MPANPDHSADEPTEEMLNAVGVALPGLAVSRRTLIAVYKAMRASRPEAQAAPKLTAKQIERLALAAKLPRYMRDTEPAIEALGRFAELALASLHAQAGVSGDAAAEGVMVPRELLFDALEFAEQQEDVIDGSDGPRPNQAMHIAQELRALLGEQ